MPDFYYEIAIRLDTCMSDELIDAIEASCLTQMDWEEDEDNVIQRVHAALEETTSGTY